jgi:predicted Zn-ribbon and HTH transcriptional regulator
MGRIRVTNSATSKYGIASDVKSFICHKCGYQFKKRVPMHIVEVWCPKCKDYWASYAQQGLFSKEG